MTEEREDELTGVLRRKMASSRRISFQRLSRADFEERFVDPLQKRRFFSWRMASVFVTAVAVVTALVTLNFFGQVVFSGDSLTASQALHIRRDGLWFGSRAIVASSVFPKHDRIQVDETKPFSFSWGGFATIIAAKADFGLRLHSQQETSVNIVSGKALFRFGKSGMRRTLLIAGANSLQITGTIVYVDVAAQTVAIIEGKTILDAKIPVVTGEEISLASGQKRKLTPETRVAVRTLAPDTLPEEKIDDSPEARLFRLYGNVYTVTLKSGNRILAAKVVEAGNLRLFTLGGPLYLAENEIAQMKKLR